MRELLRIQGYRSPAPAGVQSLRELSMTVLGRSLPLALTDWRTFEPVRTGVAIACTLCALFAEAWTDAAIRHGIPAAQAATLVAETMAGTAALLRQTDTLALRRGVTSPGGSTARGLAALERGGVRTALATAMDDVLGGTT